MKVVSPVDAGHGKVRTGSGVVVAEGQVITNAHVVVGMPRICLEQNGRFWSAVLRTVDLSRDLALLEAPGLTLAPAVMGEDEPTEGEAVFCWSYPGGEGPSFSAGSLGCLWNHEGLRLLQAELHVAPGSSGGGVFDAAGRLIAITTFVPEGSPRSVFSVPVGGIRELMARPPTLPAHPGLRPNLLEGFLQSLGRDPGNLGCWLRFTEAWVLSAPLVPDAWSARAQALMTAAARAQEMGRLPEGGETRNALEVALALDRTRAVDWHNLGVSLDGENHFPEAAAAFRESLRLRPDQGATWSALGGTLFNAGDFAGAREALVNATRWMADDAGTWSLLAHTERKLKRWTDAQRNFQIALRYSPFRVSWWVALAECAWQAGDREGMAVALERLKRLDPEAARSFSKQMKGMRS